jgi:WD40 repeat protein
MSTKEATAVGSSNSQFNPLSSLRGSIHKLALFGRRRSKPGEHLTKNFSTANTTASTRNQNANLVVDLPVMIWMDCIFPFLNRASQNCLASAHPEVALARRESYYHKKSSSSSSLFPMQWPSGTLRKKLSRPVKRVVFSPDDCTLLVAYCKPKVAQYDKLAGPNNSIPTATATTPLLFDPRYSHTGSVADLKYSPCDGTILATASRNDGTIRLWKENLVDEDKGPLQQRSNNGSTTSTQRQQPQHYRYSCIRILQVYQADLRHMTWSRDGSKIASWGNDGFLRISNTLDGTLHSRHWKTRLEVYGCHSCVAFDPTGRTVAFAHNHDVVCIWDYSGTNTSQVLPNIRDEYGTYAGNFVTGLTYSPDGKWLVVGCHVAHVKFWHVILPSTAAAAAAAAAAVGTSSTSRHGDDNNNNDDTNNYNYNNNQPLLEYAFDKEIHVGSGWSAVALLTFTPDSRYLACTNGGSQIRIIHVTTNKVLATLTGHVGTIESLAFTSNGKTLASGSCDRTVRFWDFSLWCRSI